ncbi:MAG: FGGY-family carbohydrate kinase [Oscillospiraceae bacterium]|jgi:xylulokinase|nr:FGGY-family carbohydrate kinase [Oscillospiraceae bacterium]
MQYILAHDLGTSGNKATLYDLDGNLACSVVRGYPTYYPFDGAVEHDPDNWWQAVCGCTHELLEKSGIAAGDIACVSFSGIMLGCLIVDEHGTPLRNMLIWADTRSAKQEKWMLDRVDMARGYRITGHRPSASYAAAKLLWIRDNEPGLYQKAHKMIHAKDYVVYRLTGAFATDYSDASSTNLLDIEARAWSKELLEAWDIRENLLPDLHASAEVVGRVTPAAAHATGLSAGTPVVIGGGDGSCATVGAGVVDEGDTYNIIGSSSWICRAARAPYFDPKMRTFNWLHLDPALFTPCGTMQAAGYSYSWYRDTLCGPEAFAADLAGVSPYQILNRHTRKSKPGAGGLLYLPYLLGERSPHWNHDARGAFVGLGVTTTREDMTRAVLEGVGYNLKIILDVLEGHAPVSAITMIGGGAKGREWLQILADIWGKPLLVPRYLEEATSMGAAVAGGVAIGAYADYGAARRYNKIVDEVRPNPQNAALYAHLYRDFLLTYEQLIPVYERLAQARALEGAQA